MRPCVAVEGLHGRARRELANLGVFGRTGRRAYRLAGQVLVALDGRGFLDQQRFAGHVVDVREVDLLQARGRDRRGRDEQVDIAVFEQRDAVGRRHLRERDLVWIAEDRFGERVGDVDVEALHAVGRRVEYAERRRIVLDADLDRPARFDRSERRSGGVGTGRDGGRAEERGEEQKSGTTGEHGRLVLSGVSARCLRRRRVSRETSARARLWGSRRIPRAARSRRCGRRP